MNEPKKRALVLRDFTDSGTGEQFAKGDTPMLPQGQFANYEAAGLVDTPPAAEKAAPKRASKRKPPAQKPATTETTGDANGEA